MMAVVQSLYFAGREIPIRGGAIDGDPDRTWRLVAWATAADATLPPDGWVEVVTEAGEVVAWGTLIDQTRCDSAAPGPYRLTFADAIAPTDAHAPMRSR